jgi:hypothetical protein
VSISVPGISAEDMGSPAQAFGVCRSRASEAQSGSRLRANSGPISKQKKEPTDAAYALHIGKTSSAYPGCAVDHIKALKRGEAENPSNMKWRTLEHAG